jgi:hypothetical protein
MRRVNDWFATFIERFDRAKASGQMTYGERIERLCIFLFCMEHEA